MFRLRLTARSEADAPNQAAPDRRGRIVEESRRAAPGTPVRAGAVRRRLDLRVAGLHEKWNRVLCVNDISRTGPHTDIDGAARIPE